MRGGRRGPEAWGSGGRPVERRAPPGWNPGDTMGGRGARTTTARRRHDLRRRRDGKAQAAPSWRCWGFDVQGGTRATRRDASPRAKANNGAPGGAGLTCAALEASGLDALREQRQDARGPRPEHAMRGRQQARPQEGGPQGRVLSMPPRRARVVQGACTRMLAPRFAADGPPGADGERPKRSAPAAVLRVAEAMVTAKPRGIAVDVQAAWDKSRPPLRWAPVAQRVHEPDGLHGLTLRLQASGQKGGAHGGGLSPLLRPLARTAVDRLLERAPEGPRRGPDPDRASARGADALGRLVAASPQHDGLRKAVATRLRAALAPLQGPINAEQRRGGAVAQGETWRCGGVDGRWGRSRPGAGRAWERPRLTQRTALGRPLQERWRRSQSQPMDRVIPRRPPRLRGAGRSGAGGDARRGWGGVHEGVAQTVRRHRRRARQRRGVGWQRWRRPWRDPHLGRCKDERVQRPRRGPQARPACEVPSPVA